MSKIETWNFHFSLIFVYFDFWSNGFRIAIGTGHKKKEIPIAQKRSNFHNFLSIPLELKYSISFHCVKAKTNSFVLQLKIFLSDFLFFYDDLVFLGKSQ